MSLLLYEFLFDYVDSSNDKLYANYLKDNKKETVLCYIKMYVSKQYNLTDKSCTCILIA